MQSLDKLPDWSIFQPRDAEEVVLISPAQEVISLLQKNDARIKESDSESQNTIQGYKKALADQAVLIFQLGGIIERYEQDLLEASLKRIHLHFRVLKDQMFDALDAAGLSVEDPIGKSFDEIAEFVTIDGWRTSEKDTEENVVEVIEPIVRSGNEVIRPGRVIMGSPMCENFDEVPPEQSPTGDEE